MGIFDIFLIAFGLAMDCFAVSIAAGIIFKKFQWKPILRMALLFGVFQGLMPVLGWLAGICFKSWIENYDHWIALFILSFLGIKMIREGLASEEEEQKRGKSIHPSEWRSVIMLSIATSIDALATGIVFIPYSTALFFEAITVIALVSFGFSILGNYIGTHVGKRKFNFRIEVLGGIILIGIGLKIYLAHVFGS